MTQSFARRTGWIAVGQASIKLAHIAIAVVLVRMLDADQWDSTALLLSIFVTATTIGTLGLQHGIVYFYPRTVDSARRTLVMQTIATQLCVGAASAVLIGVAARVVIGSRLTDPAQLTWLGVAIALEIPSASAGALLIAQDRIVAASLWDIGGMTVLICSTVAPVAAGFGPAGIVAGLVGGCGLRLIGTVALASRLVTRGTRTGRPRWQHLAYGLPLGLTLAVSMLNRAVDKWWIAAFDAGDFGIYAVAAQEIPILAVLPYAGGAALVTALVDAFHRGDLTTARLRWHQLTASMSRIVVPATIAVTLVSPELIPIVFSPEFSRGVVPFQLFTLITLHRVAEYGLLLRAAGRSRQLLQIAVGTLAANAVLAGAGAGAAGMTGASLGTLLASALGWWWALRAIADVLDVGIGRAFAWRAWLGQLGVSVLAGGCALATVSVVEFSGWGRLAVKLIVFAVVVAGAQRGVRATSRRPRAASIAALAVDDGRMATVGGRR